MTTPETIARLRWLLSTGTLTDWVDAFNSNWAQANLPALLDALEAAQKDTECLEWLAVEATELWFGGTSVEVTTGEQLREAIDQARGVK